MKNPQICKNQNFSRSVNGCPNFLDLSMVVQIFQICQWLSKFFRSVNGCPQIFQICQWLPTNFLDLSIAAQIFQICQWLPKFSRSVNGCPQRKKKGCPRKDLSCSICSKIEKVAHKEKPQLPEK